MTVKTPPDDTLIMNELPCDGNGLVGMCTLQYDFSGWRNGTIYKLIVEWYIKKKIYNKMKVGSESSNHGNRKYIIYTYARSEKK